MAAHFPYVFDAALSGAIASGLSGAPVNTTSSNYSTLVADAVRLATDVDLQLYNLTLSSITFDVGPDDALLMLAIVFAYFKNRNVENAGSSADWDESAKAIAVLFVNADAHIL